MLFVLQTSPTRTLPDTTLAGKPTQVKMLAKIASLSLLNLAFDRRQQYPQYWVVTAPSQARSNPEAHRAVEAVAG
jgi:hypothetical protein